MPMTFLGFYAAAKQAAIANGEIEKHVFIGFYFNCYMHGAPIAE